MKRSLIIFPVGQDRYPDWFFQPVPVSNSEGFLEVTHLAALVIGEVPNHTGVRLELGPSDTLKSALSRAGFSRVVVSLKGIGNEKATPVLEAEESAPAADSVAPTVWNRVKKFFSWG